MKVKEWLEKVTFVDDSCEIVPNKKLRSQVGGVEHFITPLGRGEWTAETMEDAKQMAIDFNQGVS